jgi:hypothetical protein
MLQMQFLVQVVSAATARFEWMDMQPGRLQAYFDGYLEHGIFAA